MSGQRDIERAVLDEREACVMLVDHMLRSFQRVQEKNEGESDTRMFTSGGIHACEEIIEAIRAGEHEMYKLRK